MGLPRSLRSLAMTILSLIFTLVFTIASIVGKKRGQAPFFSYAFYLTILDLALSCSD